jgi:hypothetical protein
MGFTVSHPNGTKDAEFPYYIRLMRKRRMDLGKLRRVPEPGTYRRWLPVWETRAEANAFAEELRKQMGDAAWSVIEVKTPGSEGPLGPLLVQLSRRPDELIFGLHSLGLVLIQSAYPKTVLISYVILDAATWDHFQKTQGEFKDLAHHAVLALTGLKEDQLEELGYVVIDDTSEETVAFVPPGQLVASYKGSGGS